MRRVFVWAVMLTLTVAGFLGVVAYAVALVVTSDRALLTEEYGSLFAFSAVAAIAGAVSIAALLKRLPKRLTFPNEWLSFFLFLVCVAAGFGVLISDRFIAATPMLALLAAASLFAFFARVLTRWSPERPVGSRGFVLPAVWGMIGAPALAVVVQLATVVMLVAGGVAGMYLAEPTLIDSLEGWLNEASEVADFGVIETPTITYAVLGVIGVAAPLSEELTKFLGVYLLFRNRVATKYGLFLAGGASGLGFAVVETLGYALMSGEAWPQVMLLRAPVALIHVAATTIVALGWYMQRQHGRYALFTYFLLAVVLHAAWNSLFVSMMVIAAGIDTSGAVDPVAGLQVLMAASAMGAVLVGSVLWIVSNARRLGRESRPMTDESASAYGFAPALHTPALSYHD